MAKFVNIGIRPGEENAKARIVNTDYIGEVVYVENPSNQLPHTVILHFSIPDWICEQRHFETQEEALRFIQVLMDVRPEVPPKGQSFACGK